MQANSNSKMSFESKIFTQSSLSGFLLLINFYICHFLISTLKEYLLQASGNSSQTSGNSKVLFETKILMSSLVSAYQKQDNTYRRPTAIVKCHSKLKPLRRVQCQAFYFLSIIKYQNPKFWIPHRGSLADASNFQNLMSR